MKKNERAARLSGPNQNFIASGNKNPFDAFYFRCNRNFFQCKKCGSDYGKFSIDGICVDCQQRVEFIRREHPHIIAQVRGTEAAREVTANG